jgi:hypothetical protein
MEAAEPIIFETTKPIVDNTKIDFIEELSINKVNKEYKIQFGKKENNKELIVKVYSEEPEELYYYQKNYTVNELKKISNIFAIYETVKDIILMMKNLEYEIDEKNEDLILKFKAFMPDGKIQLIGLDLKKNSKNPNYIIKYLFEEIKSIKKNMSNEISSLKNKYESEIKDLKEDIINLKEKIRNYKNENKKLWQEINELKISKEESSEIETSQLITCLDSKITSISSINFLLDYIRNTDKTFNFNEIKLLYRGSRDGDRTKNCHQLCDNKQNVLIIMQSDTGHIFGGYSKIGFKVKNIPEWKLDNNCFLFSLDLKKIYPVIKEEKIICHLGEESGLCFAHSLSFTDNFMNRNDNRFYFKINKKFKGLKDTYEMNGGKDKFTCKDLEVFQLL